MLFAVGLLARRQAHSAPVADLPPEPPPVRLYQQQPDPHFDDLRSISILPGGKEAVTGGLNGVQVWDLESGRAIRRPAKYSGVVFQAVVSPDGSKVLTGSSQKGAQLWDLANGRELGRLMGHPAQVIAAAITPDGKQALPGSIENSARLWDLGSGKQLLCLGDNVLVERQARQ